MTPLESADDPLQFPCDFPIKVLGTNSDGFAQGVLGVVLQHCPDYDPATLEMRASSGGKYLSVTCTIRATSRTQLDGLYQVLTHLPGVNMVL